MSRVIEAFNEWKRNWRNTQFPNAPDPQLDAIRIANQKRMTQRELDELLSLVNTVVPLFLGVKK